MRCLTDPSDPHYNDPWPTFHRRVRAAFDEFPQVEGHSLFGAKNLMADEIVSYHRLPDGDTVEVSYGRFGEHYTTALSFRPLRDDVECYDTPEGAADRLREMMGE